MSEKKTKKLVLNKETLRVLNDDELQAVGGGFFARTAGCTIIPPTMYSCAGCHLNYGRLALPVNYVQNTNVVLAR